MSMLKSVKLSGCQVVKLPSSIPWDSGHAEQMFLCLCSNLTVYRRKWQWFFYTLVQLATSSCIFLILERNISHFCNGERDNRHVLVAEYSRRHARSSLVRPIRRDVTAAARHKTSLLQQRLGAAVWSYQERRKTKAGEKEQTSREDGPA